MMKTPEQRAAGSRRMLREGFNPWYASTYPIEFEREAAAREARLAQLTSELKKRDT